MNQQLSCNKKQTVGAVSKRKEKDCALGLRPQKRTKKQRGNEILIDWINIEAYEKN